MRKKALLFQWMIAVNRLQKFSNPLLKAVDVKSVLPAALEAHNGWSIIGTSELSSKSDLLDNFLSVWINAYTAKVRLQLWAKLRNNDLEVNELNVFSLLLSSRLDYLLEYLNESLARKGYNQTSTYEFRCFLGTFLLLSSFNLSTDLNWNLMQKMTSDKAMARDHFNELIKNLRGFEMGMRFGDGPSFAWCNQKICSSIFISWKIEFLSTVPKR